MHDLFVERFAKFWLPPDESDPYQALRRRHLKADQKSMTQFNTGALMINAEKTIVLTECQPYCQLPNWVQVLPPSGALKIIHHEIEKLFGLPALIVCFKKGEIIPEAWLPSYGTSYVINEPSGPGEIVSIRNANIAKAIHLKGQAKLFWDARTDLRRRLDTPQDASEIDGRLISSAKKCGLTLSEFIDQLEAIEAVTRAEWELGKKWASSHAPSV